MTATRGHRSNICLTLTLAGFVMAIACTSCSPDRAGTISVPSGTGKLKEASGIGWVKPKPAGKAGSAKPRAGSTGPSQPTPRPR
jgi:hypothetical protein